MTIPRQSGWAYNEIVEGIRTKQIRGLWIIATNTAHSWIHQNDVRELLGQLDFLVVQDMYHSTDTAAFADLLLPAAGWGEKEGTFINSERRIGVTRAVRKAPGQALSDFRIFRLIADVWGCGPMFRNWTTPEAVFETLKLLSEGQPCDFTGIDDYQMLDECGGIQWPCNPTQAESIRRNQRHQERPFRESSTAPAQSVDFTSNERRLFANGQFFHNDRRAKFLFEAPRTVAEPADDAFPFLLLTGRGTASQWHTQTRTGKSSILRTLYPAEAYVEINPADAAKCGIRHGDRIRLSSRRGGR